MVVYWTYNIQKQQLIAQEFDALSFTNQRYAKQINALFEEKETIALSANLIVSDEIFVNPKVSNFNHANIISGEDGAVRTTDGYSGAFVPFVNFNNEVEQYIIKSEHLWRKIAPVITHSFFNFYLITNDNFIRIAPADWAIELETEHRFADDIFYSIATPENNPSKQPIWTPVYYDDIWQKWMTSLIVPIYKKGEFKGVTGSDLILDSLFNRYKDIGETENDRNLILFDKKGNILLHPDLEKRILGRQGTLNQPMDSKLIGGNALHQFIAEFIEQKVNKRVKASFDNEHGTIMISLQPLRTVDWYVGVFIPEHKVLETLVEFRNKRIVIFIFVAILLSILLQQILYHLGFKRINRLVNYTKNFRRGKVSNLSHIPPVALSNSNDEIGVLSRAFLRMGDDVNALIEGLNKRIAEKEEAKSEARRLSKAVANAGSGIFITDKHFRIEYVNKSLLNLTDSEVDDFVGGPARQVIAMDRDITANLIEHDLRTRCHWSGDLLLISRKDKPKWVSMSVAPIRDERGAVTNYVYSFQDITFMKESQKQMEKLAYFDTLTGLVNRTYFKAELKKAIARVTRGSYAFCLFYFDLDEFKRINDTLGHDAGDRLLVEVANRLKIRLRQDDIIARLGGDEFAILLSNTSNEQDAAELADVVQKTIIKPIKLGANEVIVSASIGITIATDGEVDEDTLLKQADLAMYQAKVDGRCNFHFFNEALDKAAKEKLIIENELRLALSRNELTLYYQPQVDARTSSTVGYEALIRWNHPEKGMISPDSFIPVAETTGLIVPLGQWVVEEAANFILRNLASNQAAKVSINLSARQFKDESLVPLLISVIERTNIEPHRIGLEITESMLMGNIEAAITQLNELKQLGFSISIDDFGTGYSSLSYIKQLPVDTLKIDRSFIKDIPEDKDDEEITAAIIAMAQKLNLALVAEGVETKEQIDFLCKNSCYVMQGYFYSKPLTEEQLIATWHYK